LSPILKQKLFSNWHTRRWIALIAGLFFAYQAFNNSEALTGVLSFLFLFQAVTNSGCFGSRGCAVPTSDTVETENSEVIYTEIKSD